MLTKESDIQKIVENINPIEYAKTRNFLNGKVTKISPYITHNIVPLADVFQTMKQKFSWQESEKLISELAWKEYFYNNWEAVGDDIFSDLRNPQPFVKYRCGIPAALENASTGIAVLDEAIKELKTTGYMHNHARMWLAAYVCHIGKYHWHDAAKWMYYYLYDADAAVNFQSWQWVAGTSRTKWYIANQENLNKYSQTQQKNTPWDCAYEDFENIADWEVPKEMQENTEFRPEVFTPTSDEISIDENLPTVLHHLWDLNPDFESEKNANRVLIIEPENLEKFPMSEAKINWLLESARENIPNIQVFVGSVFEFFTQYQPKETVSQQYPFVKHWDQIVHNPVPRQKMFPEISGFHRSFFAFWKKVTKKTDHIKKWHG